MSASQFSPASGVMNPCGSRQAGLQSGQFLAQGLQSAHEEEQTLGIWMGKGVVRHLIDNCHPCGDVLGVDILTLGPDPRDGHYVIDAGGVAVDILRRLEHATHQTIPGRLHQETNEEPAVRLQGFKDPLHFPFPNSGPLKDRIALGVPRFQPSWQRAAGHQSFYGSLQSQGACLCVV